MRNFYQMLKKLWANNQFVCVGLDSNLDKIPISVRQSSIADTMFSFNRQIIDATKDIVCAYKTNIAFYEAQGIEGLSALLQTTEYIKKEAPEIPIILDAKRADIGSSNEGYVQSAFNAYSADAITVHPYLGAEALQPFLEQKDKGIIVLCRTSNSGAGEFQDLQINNEPLYRVVAKQVTDHWNKNNNCALVVGATYPDELKEIREIVGNMPILIPGIGAQGGNVEKTIQAGLDSNKEGVIINSSRGVIFASDKEDFAEVARQKTLELGKTINQYR